MARRRGSGEASARWFLHHVNRGRKRRAASARYTSVPAGPSPGAAFVFHSVWVVGEPPAVAAGASALSLEALHAGALPYIRAGKSWRLVREDFSREGVGGQPEVASGSHPSSGGTGGAGRRRPGRVRPRTPVSCIPDGRPRPAFCLVPGGGEGRGGENPGCPEDRGALGGPTGGRPEAGTMHCLGYGHPTRRLGSTTSGMEGVNRVLLASLLGGWGRGTSPGACRGSGDHQRSRHGRPRPRRPPKSTVFGLFFRPRRPGGPRTTTGPPPPASSRRSESVEGWLARPRRTVEPLRAPVTLQLDKLATRSIHSHVKGKCRSTSRQNDAFSGVFDLTSVSAVPENPPEVTTSSYIPPGGSKSQKTCIS